MQGQTWFYLSVVEWMVTDLNVSLQSIVQKSANQRLAMVFSTTKINMHEQIVHNKMHLEYRYA